MYIIVHTGDTDLLGLDEWQGALIIVIAVLLVIGFCIALGLVSIIIIWLDSFDR